MPSIRELYHSDFKNKLSMAHQLQRQWQAEILILRCLATLPGQRPAPSPHGRSAGIAGAA